MGLFNYIVHDIFLPFLTFSYNHIYPNYGVSIILLTFIIKLLFYPLSVKQFRSMKITQKMQPKLKAIQEKYKGQPEKLQKEMMALWKESGANPLSGCLPSLVQLPVFLAIFSTVRSSAFTDLIHQPGVHSGFLSFWLQDLSLSDPTFILPTLIGLLMFWSQKMMTVDPKQAQIFMFMPFIMFFFSIKMPAGVLLYWATSMLLSNIQQQGMLFFEKEPSKPDNNKGVN